MAIPAEVVTEAIYVDRIIRTVAPYDTNRGEPLRKVVKPLRIDGVGGVVLVGCIVKETRQGGKPSYSYSFFIQMDGRQAVQFQRGHSGYKVYRRGNSYTVSLAWEQYLDLMEKFS